MAHRRRRPTSFLVAALLSVLVAAPALSATPAGEFPIPVEERFDYRWSLTNFLGRLASLFLPSRGEGSLRFESAGGTTTAELLITSQGAGDGEFWRYGAEIESESGRTVRAWSTYLFRGERKSRSSEIEDEDVVDVASAIYLIRRNLPTESRRMEIWSDGKIYLVAVTPRGVVERRISGRERLARHYEIRGVESADTRFWKGKLDLWFSIDGRATPFEILIERRGIGVRLQIVE